MESARGDRALMERIQFGDTRALDEVLRRYWLKLVAYADHLVDDADVAEDVVQDVVLRFWDQRSSWIPTNRLAGYLYRATRNTCLNELDKRRVRQDWAEHEERSGVRRLPSTPLELIERAELRALLVRVVEELPPKRREVFVLARFHGRRYRDIAEIMDISPRTVANQLTAAMRDLRERLARDLPDYVSSVQPR